MVVRRRVDLLRLLLLLLLRLFPAVPGRLRRHVLALLLLGWVVHGVFPFTLPSSPAGVPVV